MDLVLDLKKIWLNKDFNQNESYAKKVRKHSTRYTYAIFLLLLLFYTR